MAGSGESPLFGLQMATLLCVLTTESEEKPTLVSLLTRALIPSLGSTFMASSNPNHLPKALPPNTITLEVRTSTYDLGEAQTFSPQYMT